jgi:hypothetical protein
MLKPYSLPAVVDRYSSGRYRDRYDELMEGLLERNTVRIEDGTYHANAPR